jgi:methionyl-tRNA formyltransferase
MAGRPALVFMGSGPFGVPALERLVREGFAIRAVYTQPPRPAGRGWAERRTPVHEAALRLGIGEIRTPGSLRGPGEHAAFAALGADLALVAAYGLILPRPVLDAPRLGCINIHGSKLPRWRGAAPIQRAIEAGDTATGVSFFLMDEGIDTGPLLAVYDHPIRPRIRAPELHDELAALAAAHVVEVLDGYASGRIRPVPQPGEGASYAAKVRREEGHLDFRAPAALLERRIRAFDPWPGCWCFFGRERLIVLDAEVVPAPPGGAEPGTVVGLPLVVACGEDALSLLRVQRQGRRPLPAEELQRGFPIPAGSRLG